MLPRLPSRLLTLAIGLCLPLSTLSGAMLVDWGGNYVSGNVVFASGSVASRNYGGFTSGDPQLLSDSASYNASAPDFYGQVTWPVEANDIGPITGSGLQVVNSGSLDRIELKRGGTILVGLILFRQANFLNGLDSGNVSFDSSSTVTMNINTFAAYDAGRVAIRLQGGTMDGYYISQETPFNGTGLKSANLTSLTWLSYNPASDLDGISGSSVNLLEGGLINHITEVGFYAQQSVGAEDTDSVALRLDSFEVTAVPEPSASFATFTGFGLLMLIQRRRSRTVC